MADPTPSERQWFTHRHTGDRGFLVQREGKEFMKLDRVMEEVIRPFRPGEWIPEQESRPLTRYQVAQIAYAADQQLAFFMGDGGRRKDWLSMLEHDRIDFMEHGPIETGLRGKLFVAVMECLEESMKP